MEASKVYILALVTNVMWKSLLPYIYGLLCNDYLTKCNATLTAKKKFECLRSYSNNLQRFIVNVHTTICIRNKVVFTTLHRKKLEKYRTYTNACGLVEYMKAKRIIVLKELGKFTL